MANYDDFKKKAKAAVDSFADASVDAYKAAEEKTRILARKTKLRAGIVNDKATVRRLSVELGTRYHKKYKDDENSEFAQICAEITCAHERIADKEAEIAELKARAGAKPETTQKVTTKPKAAEEPEAAEKPEDASPKAEECCADDPADCCTDHDEPAPEDEN